MFSEFVTMAFESRKRGPLAWFRERERESKISVIAITPLLFIMSYVYISYYLERDRNKGQIFLQTFLHSFVAFKFIIFKGSYLFIKRHEYLCGI